MLRTVIEPQTRTYTLQIPAEYLNRKVEILILPLDQEGDLADVSLTETAGILKSHKIDPVKWQNELRDDWSQRE